MNWFVSALGTGIETRLSLTTENGRDVENNKHYDIHKKRYPTDFGYEIVKVTVCLPDCKECTEFYTDITEKYLLRCVCPCHSKGH